MKGFEQSLEVAQYIYETIKMRSEEEIKVLDVSEITPIADIFLIATASNTRAVAGLCDEIELKLREKGYEVKAKEGHHAARWILLDYNGVMVHLFHKEEAEFYNLDKLWSDGKVIDFL